VPTQGGDLHYVSHADLGGRSGFGSVVPEPGGAVFHAAWEARIHALTLAMGATGSWNLDMMRRARETLPNYLELSYYEIWLGGLEKLLVANGLVTPDELAAGSARRAPKPVTRVLRAGEVALALAKGSPTERAPTSPARYGRGQKVRMRAAPVEHHTRLPAYLCGRTGVIERVLGPHVFADSHAEGLGEDPQWLYTVVFDAAELWGAEVNPGHTVSCDAWQPYIEVA
jgi:nitrile hydratase subunit beta